MKKSLVILLIIIIAIALGDLLNLGQYLKNKTNPPTISNEATKIPFHLDEKGDYYGELTVTGYAEKKQIPEPFCEENCKTYDYVFFTLIDTDNKALPGFMGVNEGNAFIDTGVGLGCDENGIITYYNDSDEFGMTAYSVTPELSTKILGSSKESPVTIRLERLLYTSGRGAPACYSHFTYIRNP